jgi:ketosteroid isomerase-like protein
VTRTDTERVLREIYAAYGAKDLTAIDALAHDDLVLHVPGSHPLAGEYQGKDQMWQYLAKVAEVAGDRPGGFAVHALTTDDDGHGVALLEGTIRDFVRPVVHVWHVSDGRAAEYWEASLDQQAEDAFWTDALAPE